MAMLTIDDVLIRESIRLTMSRYAVAGDSANYVASARTFCEDGRIIVQGKDPLVGRAAIEAGLKAGYKARKGDAPGNFQRHNLLTSAIEIVSTSEARATTYVQVLTERGFDHAGVYHDVYARTAEGWLIKERHANVDWMRDDSRFRAWPGNTREGRE
jgi:hypothetical protein